ncbi:hypothetical protein C2857_000024 [Epichloe festucae Fl1]|uniref:Uncharacterized protein n=1 Tax=Epichloe festucae (strain Fl1) TaxID=877507 RepID=A0A7S9KMZ2_EPIFF|nr:hypothetical protein C2857_000024 [Epichloe festucae Fl1]
MCTADYVSDQHRGGGLAYLSLQERINIINQLPYHLALQSTLPKFNTYYTIDKNMMFSSSGRKSGILVFLFSIFSTLLLFSLHSSTALAAPVESTEALIVTRAKNIPNKEEVLHLIKPENLNDFSKWAKEGEPKKDKAIFFTGQGKKDINKIVSWAKDKKLTSVRQIWKSDNFCQKGEYKEVNDKDFEEFQKAFSKFYAEQSDGTAYLVFPHKSKPKKTGIFWSVELDAIIDKKKVNKIVWIDQNKISDKDYKWEKEEKMYWKKGDSKPDGA